MRITKEYFCFGNEYRIKQFAAVDALDKFERLDELYPTEILCLTEVKYDGEWFPLSVRDNVNVLVKDHAFVLPAMVVLRALISKATEFNFGFLNSWVGVKVPFRFQSESVPVESDHTDPVISQITTNGAATVRELEEYYSLEDAFKMFDVIAAKSVNAALANEAASTNKPRR